MVRRSSLLTAAVLRVPGEWCLLRWSPSLVRGPTRPCVPPSGLFALAQVNNATLGAYIFFADLATSFWFGILLAVSAGYWWVLGARVQGAGGVVLGWTVSVGQSVVPERRRLWTRLVLH